MLWLSGLQVDTCTPLTSMQYLETLRVKCVCVLEPYRNFPVELIISFFHFSFFYQFFLGNQV